MRAYAIGSANISCTASSACTMEMDPVCRAVACAAKPSTLQPSPASHTGLRSSRATTPSTGSQCPAMSPRAWVTARVTRCCSAAAAANSPAASRPRMVLRMVIVPRSHTATAGRRAGIMTGQPIR
ncbi:hypothetical protein Cme02nite_74830 [Catellatospora methionotrophica]|uniref:Uncharacterized protein n=1 Tax=Catellatospora methionotrophica TaxID=121620 RepID=A0A8J3PL53_9ACTN|nr:hypothetical protein Cme02nite_74830 [Catellatospora methionotrophica]